MANPRSRLLTHPIPSFDRFHGSSPESSAAMRMFALGVMVSVAMTWAVIVDMLAGAAWIRLVVLVAAIAPAALIVLISLTPIYTQTPRGKWVAMASFVICSALVALPWNERKRFVHELHSVQVGMPISQVRSMMRGYIERVGAGQEWMRLDDKERLAFSGTLTYRWSKTDQYDADVGQVIFSAGRVVEVRFLPD